MANDVQIGVDGWLFLKGGSNKAEEFFASPNALRSECKNGRYCLIDDLETSNN
jgi:hypothetical protein